MCHGGEHRGGFAGALAQAAHNHALAVLPRELRQRLAGAAFEKHEILFGGERGKGGGEADRLPRVARPIHRVRRIFPEPLAGYRGDNRDARFAAMHRRGEIFERRDHRLHHGAVKGMRGLEPLRCDAVRDEPGFHPGHRLLRAGEHTKRGAVHRGEGDIPGRVRGGLGFAEADREHHAARLFLYQPGTGGHEAQGVL